LAAPVSARMVATGRAVLRGGVREKGGRGKIV